jgi:hypothetical protein
MTEWKRIEMRGEPTVTSDAQASRLVIVSVPLEPRPDEVWTAIFNSGPPPGVEFYVSAEFPHVSGGSVQFRCTPADVEKHHAQAKRWVEGTNTQYEERVIPEMKRQEEAKRADSEERRQTVEEAKRKLEELQQNPMA